MKDGFRSLLGRVTLSCCWCWQRLVLVGCGDGAGGANGELGGTWEITTSSTGGAPFGNGSASVSFLFALFGDLYVGTGTVGGVTYSVALSALGDQIFVGFATDADGDEERMSFDGTRTGNTISGTYEGEGSYDGRTGMFTMTR